MNNLKGELRIFMMQNLKPNFSALSRIYNIDRRVIKKMYSNMQDGTPDDKKAYTKPSKLDKHFVLIKEKLSIPGVNKRAVYEFIVTNVDQDIGSYSNFRKYTQKHVDELIPKANDIHLRFETSMSKQMQFDWKGPMTLHTKDGTEITFYVFSTTLCASRLHKFTYSKFMTLESVERCLIETFEYMNGVPEECLTDNMTSIVNNSKKEFRPEFKSFAKDMGFNPKKCKFWAPETKGKDESCNRFINWLLPYDYELNDEAELIQILKILTDKVNQEINQTTNMTPISLFEKEKEYLKPLPNKQVYQQYLDTMIPVKVSNGLLVYYKGSQYSVPAKYINQTVKLTEVDNKLYIYYNKDLIASHEISTNKINYQKEHYIEGLRTKLDASEDEIEAMALKNLELLDKVTNN